MRKVVEDPTGVISMKEIKLDGSEFIFGKITKYAKKKSNGKEGVSEIIVELFLPQSHMQSGSGYSLVRSFRSSFIGSPILSHFITTREDVLGYHMINERTLVDEVGKSVVVCYCFTNADEAFDWFVSERAKSDFIRYAKE